MGALHEAHLSLVKRSKRENEITVASIFVNPTQFGPKEDFKAYPRPWDKDHRALIKAEVDVLFAPSPKVLYTPAYSTEVSVKKLTNTLCGAPASRGPQHFVGVATVVAKLFNCVRPTRAYFGLKDYQQLRVIEQMNEDLNFGIKIVRCPTMREKDGLAMSSRNAYLSAAERREAPRLFRALQSGRKLLTSSPRMSPRAVCKHIQSVLKKNPSFIIDYVELVDAVTLQRVSKLQFPILLAVAVRLGCTRLIDNIVVQ